MGEVFDPLGRVAPIIGAMKLDVSDLHRLGLGWDDKIPENLREVWKNNFEMINFSIEKETVKNNINLKSQFIV